MTPTQTGVFVMTDKKWTKEEVAAKLESDDKWLVRGLLAIHARQTGEEQLRGVTVENNGVGFNGVDSAIMTEMVVFHKHHGYLTAKQISLVRKKLLKYAGQLANIANSSH
jgi:hypothetical protein